MDEVWYVVIEEEQLVTAKQNGWALRYIAKKLSDFAANKFSIFHSLPTELKVLE